MFAQPQTRFVSFTRPTRLTNKRRTCNTIVRANNNYYLGNHNSKPLSEIYDKKLLHVLTFHRQESEGIYSIKERGCNGNNDINYIVAFRTFDEAFRYKTLLEAEMDLNPYIQFVSKLELNHTCTVGNYKCRVVDRDAFIIPPTESAKITDWERENVLFDEQWGEIDI